MSPTNFTERKARLAKNKKTTWCEKWTVSPKSHLGDIMIMGRKRDDGDVVVSLMPIKTM